MSFTTWHSLISTGPILEFVLPGMARFGAVLHMIPKHCLLHTEGFFTLFILGLHMLLIQYSLVD